MVEGPLTYTMKAYAAWHHMVYFRPKSVESFQMADCILNYRNLTRIVDDLHCIGASLYYFCDYLDTCVRKRRYAIKSIVQIYFFFKLHCVLEEGKICNL